MALALKSARAGVDSLEEQQGETLLSRLHLAKNGRSEPRTRLRGVPVPRLQEAQRMGP